ncbi:hypothetical protein B0T14DRAFT_530259 [Immersiella caudata]|uniref:Uncharacterized protein n=1 Tax=Immersiella caudata TaxID=314043 RepID=A0AA39WB24_9PEZI|nr:hypothetical protein B0T14DRAFT_530259 [Immersiella caudata]
MQSRPNSLLAMASRLSNLPMRQVSVVALALVFLFGVYTLLGGDTASYNLYGPGNTGGGSAGDNIPGAITHTDHSKPWSPPGRPPPATPAVKETGRVVGLVFFGRREHVKILDCYLQRNLKVNGGLLDEIIFSVNTGNKDDLAYLDNELLPNRPQYRKYALEKHKGWLGQWGCVTERDTIYIKIDDDVIFVEDNTVATMVETLREKPDLFAVSANIINNPALSWVHWHLGVFEPYWPEMTAPATPLNVSWRASELPSYKGPRDGPEGFNPDGSTPAPFKGHRWLPVREKPAVPAPTEENKKGFPDPPYPVTKVTYDAFGPSLRNWGAGAQLHYSFLQHVERGETWKYKFKIWDYQYDRVSINFFGIRGGDIMDVYPFPKGDDEGYLTVDRPRELRRHVVVAGEGLAVHFAFGPQYKAHDKKGLADTDLFSRYQAYADEMVCPFPKRNDNSSSAERQMDADAH